MALAVMAITPVTSTRAQDAGLQGALPMVDPLSVGVALLAVVVFSWALISIRNVERARERLRRRCADLETQLNDAETALTAEPSLLFIWRGRNENVERVVGDMRGTCTVPHSSDEQAHFSLWLDAESAATLNEALGELRRQGTPFNFGIKNRMGELLEADGRTAGGLATLRLRPLAGERREVTKLAHDYRRLLKQVERLTAMLDSLPLPVWLRGQTGALLWANRTYVDAVESESVEDIIQNGRELVSQIRNPKDAAVGSGQLRRRREHTVIAGAKRAIEVVEADVPDGEVGVAVDISALEESKKELKRHLRSHASTLDKLATAIAIFGPDKRLRFYNAAYAQLWPLDSSWLDTQPSDSEILDRLREQRCIPEQANYRDWRARQLEAYSSLDTREDWWHLPDGRTLRVIAEQHPFGGVTYLYENITEQIALESRYNELIGVQRETLDNLQEGVALFGTDGRLKLFNPAYAEHWGLDEAFLSDQPHIDQIIEFCRQHLPEDPSWDEMKYAVTSVDDDRRSIQSRIERPDGRVMDFALVPLPDGNTLITYTDVTDSSRMEKALRERAEALEAADKLKTDFLSHVSYELRTPLTNIIGFADALVLGYAAPLQARQEEYVKNVLTSSADLLAIIDAILDLTSIDAGAMELHLETIDVAETLTEVAHSLADRIEKRRITLEVEIPENAGTIRADGKRLKQMLGNLLSNAIGFSPEESVIRMGAHRSGGELVLWVTDKGRGMDIGFQKMAFERFRARPSASGHRGPGLGLPLVKSFAELHGGTVSLRSKLNEGTTVICRLPVDGPDGREDWSGKADGKVSAVAV